MKLIKLFYLKIFITIKKKLIIFKEIYIMKAAVLEENKLVKIKDLYTPDIKENEVLVEVKYSGVYKSLIFTNLFSSKTAAFII